MCSFLIKQKGATMNITKVTARQFEKIVERQGKTIIDFATGKEYKVLFSKAGATNMQDKVKISYAEECPLAKGSIIQFKNNYYILVNQDNIESDVYCSSTAMKCNDVWEINGYKIPVVCGNLSSYNPKAGTVYTNGKSTVGNITIYTSSDTMVTEIVPGDINFCCDDFYHIVNKFSIDGLTYLYMQRETLTGTDTLQYVDEVYNFDIGQEFQLHIARVMKDSENKIIGRYLQESVYTYVSSNEAVATVTQDGLLNVVGKGAATITVATDDLTLDINISSVSFPYVQMKCDVTDPTTGTVAYNTGKILMFGYDADGSVEITPTLHTSMTETSNTAIKNWEIYDNTGTLKATLGYVTETATRYSDDFSLLYDDTYEFDYYKFSISTYEDLSGLMFSMYVEDSNINLQTAKSYYEGQTFTVKVIYEDGTTGEAVYELTQNFEECQDAIINDVLFN